MSSSARVTGLSCVLLFWMFGCATVNEFSEPIPVENLPREVVKEIETLGGHAPAGGGPLYWCDRVDTGNDPFTPGCHLTYNDNQCTQFRWVHSGDKCSTQPFLLEFTRLDPHNVADDLVTYDCDKLCLQTRNLNGVCVKVDNLCGPQKPSAFCYCLPPNPEVEG